MNSSLLSEKSIAFALRIVRLAEYLQKEHRAFVLSDQILRSGTSIGANIAEARVAQSRADFIAKLYIAFKEASETKYWLDLIHNANYITDAQHASLFADCNAIFAMLQASIKTARNK